MSEVDRLWAAACSGDKRAFGDWAGRVERPVLRSLRSFARATDIEGVVQETLVRMWRRAQQDGARLEGENASLRYAIVLARNLALNLARKHRRQHLLLPEDLDDNPADPPSDPFLRLVLERCIQALSDPARRALAARLSHGHRPDPELAALVRMTRNTFLQNITRARRQLEQCLSKNGVHEHEALT